MPFTFVDLFAGIGGFHSALSDLGGECVYASEIDPHAAAVYELNWGINPLNDITEHANDDTMSVPACDVLTAGFPCQPFSKSGAQRGMEETRGTLYWNILKIVKTHHPSMVLLENVRNLAGPRHLHEWQVIIETLRAEGYVVSDTPTVFSPHLLPPHLGGTPQVRERVFICATHQGDAARDLRPEPPLERGSIDGWDPQNWLLEKHLPLEDLAHDSEASVDSSELSESELLWINAWDEFVQMMWEQREGRRLPGFPLWADAWEPIKSLKIPAGTPAWKADFLRKNSEFYSAHKKPIDKWLKAWKVRTDAFPASRRKLEWQAQDTPTLWDTIMHFRPSGIRAKRATYVPALVAITQTSIIGPRRRRLTVREGARLQGLPESFTFGDQPDAKSFRQLGNGVAVGAVKYVLQQHALRDEAILAETNPELRRILVDEDSIPLRLFK